MKNHKPVKSVKPKGSKMKKNTNTPEPKQVAEPWTLEFLTVSGIDNIPTATVRLVRDKKTIQDAGTGGDSMDAIFKTIDRLTGQSGELMFRTLSGVAVCKAEVSVNFSDDKYSSTAGRAANADGLKAAALAYLDALNQYLNDGGSKKQKNKASAC